MSNITNSERQIKARLVSMVVGATLAVITIVVAPQMLPPQSKADPRMEVGYIYSGTKSESTPFIHANLTEDSLVCLGSSEFSTPASLVPQVPANTFATHNWGLRLMLVGEAFDQCLWDTMALGALSHSGSLPHNKVVIIVALGQFTDAGIDSSTFAERFSYPLYKAFCHNTAVGEESKEYVRTRLIDLGIDAITLDAAAGEGLKAQLNDLVFSAISDAKLRLNLMEVRAEAVPVPNESQSTPDWNSMRSQAHADAERLGSNNEWGVENSFWSDKLEPALDSLAGARAGETYSRSTEYGDLDAFLNVCEEVDIEPLIVVCPSLGPYYDHIGVDKQTRAAAYARIRDVVSNHNRARLADFSDREYERHFLFDIVHFGWLGWVDVEQTIYEFVQGDA